MSDPASSDEERDERNLKALRDARASGTLAAQQDALARLLDPYWGWGRSIAYGKIKGVPNRHSDAEEIAQELIRRLVKALENKLEFAQPFHVVAAKNLGWAIKDYWRRKYGEEAFAMDPQEMPDDLGASAGTPSVADQANTFGPYLNGLSERERELVIERIFLDMTPEEIASRHGMSRGAVDTALHRSLKKLRASPQQDDVRNRGESTA